MPAFKFKSCALAAMLLVLSLGSQALTLGRAKGAAIVAQPLSLLVPISAATDEDLSDLCFEADVFYGDNKVDGSKVTLTSDPAIAGQTWQLRIVSRLPVDEPVVTLNLRSACSAKASRRYVILSDVAPEAPAFAGGGGQSPIGVVKATGLASASATTSALDRLPSPSSNNTSVEEKPKLKRNTRTEPKEASLASSREIKRPRTNKPRLKLAPLDLLQERDPLLKTSPELLSSPTEDMQKRVEAAALWRALNLTPDDVIRDASRLQALEKNVQKLTDASGLNQRQINDLLGRLERAEGERYRNPLVFGLGVVILLLAAGGVWMFRRQRHESDGSPWWRADSGTDDGPESLPASSERVATSLEQMGGSLGRVGANPHVVAPSVAPAPGVVDIDLELDFSGLDAPDSSNKVGVTEEISNDSADASGHRDFSHSLSSGLRAVNTQEMLDIRQQAEFFMTLGQHDDAIALLEGHVADSVELNPSIYLDLLKIFHTLSRKAEFDKYRKEFNAVFSGQVSTYADFLQVGKSLEDYPVLCEELTRIWPSREALEFLESCLVRQPRVESPVLVDLEAFKDLLLLHAVGRRLVEALDGAPVAFSTSKSLAQKLQVFNTGPTPLDVALPELASAGVTEVDLELDIPDAPALLAASPVDNLIDFDVSGFSNEQAPVNQRRT